MNNMPLNENICEQLSAWMDGELSKEEALFIERRLQHDQALQAMHARLLMSSACMRGQAIRPMPQTLCSNIQFVLANEQGTVTKSRKPIFAWAAAASVAFAAMVFVPGMMQNGSVAPVPMASNPVTTEASSADDIATFASADLVAGVVNPEDSISLAASTIDANPGVPNASGVSDSNPDPSLASAVPSPETFPLNISSEKKTWPRAAVNANSDPALEAYLVRHNQMMSEDGMGGFVPYVDVVAQEADKEKTEAGKIDAGKLKAGDSQ